jgi:hypothetical protein
MRVRCRVPAPTWRTTAMVKVFGHRPSQLEREAERPAYGNLPSANQRGTAAALWGFEIVMGQFRWRSDCAASKASRACASGGTSSPRLHMFRKPRGPKLSISSAAYPQSARRCAHWR